MDCYFVEADACEVTGMEDYEIVLVDPAKVVRDDLLPEDVGTAPIGVCPECASGGWDEVLP